MCIKEIFNMKISPYRSHLESHGTSRSDLKKYDNKLFFTEHFIKNWAI